MATAYTSLDAQTLSVIMWPPSFSPEVTYGSYDALSYNNLRGGVFQFGYRYAYSGKEKSVLSPYSKIAIPQDEELSNGDFVDDITVNNELRVKLAMGHETVEKFECFVRKGNTRDWQRYEVKKKSPVLSFFATATAATNELSVVYDVVGGTQADLQVGMIVTAPYIVQDAIIERIEGDVIYLDTMFSAGGIANFSVSQDYVYSIFRNDVLLEGADQQDLARPFDFVPIKADHQELLGGNRIVYGENTEGQNAVDVDAEVLASVAGVDFDNISIGCTVVLVGTIIAPTVLKEARIYTSSSGGTYSEYVITFTATTAHTVVYRSGVDDTAAQVAARLATQIELIDDAVIDEVSYHDGTSGGDPYTRILFTTTGAAATVAGNRYLIKEKYKTFPLGSNQQFGIVYKDNAGRKGAVNVCSKLSTKVPNYYDCGLSGYDVPRVTMDWSIDNIPPSWATKYSWVYGGSTHKPKLTVIVNNYLHSSPQIANSGGKTYIDVNTNHVTYSETNTKVVVPAYEFEKGDKIRLIGFGNSTDQAWRLIDELVDEVIEGVDYATGDSSYKLDDADTPDFELDADGNKIKTASSVKIIIHQMTYSSAYSEWDTSSPQLLFEIYRPQPEFNVYFEIGEDLAIGDAGSSNAYHTGTVDQVVSGGVSSSPATGTFDFGQCYLKLRYIGSRSFHTSELYMSDFYDSASNDVGAINIVDESIRQVKRTGIRWGGVYVDNADINNLSTFKYEDEQRLEEKHGDIAALRQIGFTLKMVQRTKVSSAYVGVAETFNQDGTKALVTSSNVVGNIRAMEADYGSVHPDSVVVYEGNMYFFDVNSGKVIRDSGGGLQPISEIKMQSYFRLKAEQLLEHGVDNAEVCGFVDAYNKMVGFQFHSTVTDGHDDIIAFHVPSNRWVAFFDYEDSDGDMPSKYSNIGSLTTLSFLDGVPYLHNLKSVARGLLFDDSKDFLVDVVGNQSPIDIKVFNSIEIDSNKKWTAPDTDSIEVEKNHINQQSRLVAGQIERQEGVWRAGFLKDMLTSGRVKNILSGWSNGGQGLNEYDTFTTSGANITSMIKTGSSEDSVASTSYPFVLGDMVDIECTVTVGSGTPPVLKVAGGVNRDGDDSVSLVSGVNKVSFRMSETNFQYITLTNLYNEPFNGSLTFTRHQIRRPNSKDLYNGNALRGKAIRVKLKNSDTDEVKLKSVIIKSDISG